MGVPMTPTHGIPGSGRKRGRPILPPGERGVSFNLRVTPARLARWKACAGAGGVSKWLTGLAEKAAQQSEGGT